MNYGLVISRFLCNFYNCTSTRKANDKAEEKAYNNGYCPKCGKRMRTLEDDWGNTTGFGCVCGHRTSDRYIGSDIEHIHKK